MLLFGVGGTYLNLDRKGKEDKSIDFVREGCGLEDCCSFGALWFVR
jgi:hypothetical protein